MSKKRLISIADGTDAHGQPARLWIYQSGRSYYISTVDQEHLCHPSVTSLERVKGEALLVYHVKIATFTEPGGST